MLNGFDIIVLIVLVIAFVKGYKKGLISMLIGLAIIVLAAIFGGTLAKTFLPEINKILDISPQWANTLSYVSAFLIIAVALTLVGHFIQKVFDAVNLSFVNRLGGSVISIGSAMVVLSILLNLLLFVDSGEKLIKPNVKKESFFYERVKAVVPAIVPYLNISSWDEILPQDIKKQLDTLDKVLESTQQGASIDSNYQKQYFETDSI